MFFCPHFGKLASQLPCRKFSTAKANFSTSSSECKRVLCTSPVEWNGSRTSLALAPLSAESALRRREIPLGRDFASPFQARMHNSILIMDVRDTLPPETTHSLSPSMPFNSTLPEFQKNISWSVGCVNNGQAPTMPQCADCHHILFSQVAGIRCPCPTPLHARGSDGFSSSTSWCGSTDIQWHHLPSVSQRVAAQQQNSSKSPHECRLRFPHTTTTEFTTLQ